MDKIDFIGIGAQKAATSWLHQCLQEHPDVCIPPQKEVHFFSKYYEQGKGWYFNQFSDCGKEKLLGEISTSYLSNTKALSRIKEINYDTKIIVSLRNPIDRALSHIRHLQSTNHLPKDLSVRKAVKQYPEIIENGMYGKYLLYLYRQFPKNNVHIIFFEDIEANPSVVIQNLFCFLGIDKEYIPSAANKRYNTSAFRSSNAHRLIHRIYFFLKKSSIGVLSLRFIRFFGITPVRVADVFSISQDNVVNISTEEKEFLNNVYREDRALLIRVLTEKNPYGYEKLYKMHAK